MARIPDDVIRSIETAASIIDVVSRYVTLKRSGTSHKGLCPFHEEKTPSFHVWPDSGRFKCFGCGEGGDVFHFLMQRASMSFTEAVEELARETGIEIPREEETPRQREAGARRAAALHALEFAQGLFHACLGRPVAEKAARYLADRGFTAETLEAFGIGYAPEAKGGLHAYARGKGLTDRALVDAGLARRRDDGSVYNMFRGRITFPIHDLRGRIIGFGARALGDAQPKYLNSPDSPLFHKGREMYGIHLARDAARRAGRLLLVEGYTDVMHCRQAGIPETAAALGTALTPDNAKQLRRFALPVHLLYDGDEAGRRAAERAADVLLEEEVEASVALLPPGKDPADLVTREGPDALEEVLADAQDLWNYRMERVCERTDLSHLDASSRAADELLGTVARMKNPIRRERALKLLSERFGIQESILRDRLPQSPRAAPVADAPEPTAPPPPPAWQRAERDFIAAGLADRGLWERIEAAYPPEDFRDAGLRILAGALRDLRRGGQSCGREELRSAVADQEQAFRALQALEAGDGAEQRALRHLEGMSRAREVQSAVAKNDLEAVVRARKGGGLDPAK